MPVQAYVTSAVHHVLAAYAILCMAWCVERVLLMLHQRFMIVCMYG
jgi:hypothetical protein